MLRLITMITIFTQFKRDEKGLALTEYLILLGLLTAAVIAAVLLFGEQLGLRWQSWADWMSNTDLGAPS
ncbi:hypothetical protein [Actibacterium sp. MT2.3-13A]|uniref:Flp family type IVb pilin n=1 Tax=Actibacterium sp. MT2.3-13A TaxID=2828332 RepID=UPI001BA5BF5A|nr:hypothetical protein [Actibacterium sp. MT2.3-13A]